MIFGKRQKEVLNFLYNNRDKNNFIIDIQNGIDFYFGETRRIIKGLMKKKLVNEKIIENPKFTELKSLIPYLIFKVTPKGHLCLSLLEIAPDISTLGAKQLLFLKKLAIENNMIFMDIVSFLRANASIVNCSHIKNFLKKLIDVKLIITEGNFDRFSELTSQNERALSSKQLKSYLLNEAGIKIYEKYLLKLEDIECVKL